MASNFRACSRTATGSAFHGIVLQRDDRWEKRMSTKVTARLSPKFQISVPKAVRTAHSWQAGQEFAFIPKGTGVLLVPVPKREELAGLARGARPEGYRDRDDRV